MDKVSPFIYGIFSILITLLSCDSKKEIVKKEVEQIQIDSNIIMLGYVVGYVNYNETSLCDYTLVEKETGLHLDPINFNDYRFKAFRVQGENVLFKYRSLRRANRCVDIQPIELIDIKFN